MQELLLFLDSIHPLSHPLRARLEALLKTRTFSRRDYLLKAGHISRHIYFIEKGLVRCYYMLGDREISAWFMKEGDVVISVSSFLGQLKSAESIQALEQTTVQYISYDELQQLYLEFESFNVHGRKVLEHYYVLSEQRAISMRSLKAKERYACLLEQQPQMLQRVPRKYLASYLGVTEATFSNINGKPVSSIKPLL
jgi:CRP/FNR family transcriptional regulator, anaerobic regulatory protein